MSQARLLIRSANVVLTNEVVATNVLVEAGKIIAIDASPTSRADEVIDASGLVLMPGAIDDQVHFRDPGLTHKEDLRVRQYSVRGGRNHHVPGNAQHAAASYQPGSIAVEVSRAAQVCRVNFGFYIGATENNVAELQRAAHAPGIKIFIGSSTGDMLVDSQAALERIFAETHLPICAHCEDETTVRANRAQLV